ncbi:MAG: DUF1116 domain-containing protein [Betaproteobacteria bacterium]|nr:DUF1116 domain-containing protein [Betaproteobacteria bacterium]
MPGLLQDALSVINVGVDSFLTSVLESGGAGLHLDWRPPGNGDPDLAWMLARLMGDSSDASSAGSLIDSANARAVERIIAAQPVLVDVALKACEVWPDMGRTLLHAGAPVPWDAMCGPMKGSMIGAVLYEGWAGDAAAAERMLAAGEIPFAQCHDYSAVGPMSGIISRSMPLFVVKNTTHGNTAYTLFNEGIGKVLRFGANNAEVIDRLRWIASMLAPALKSALQNVEVQSTGGIDLKAIQSQALLMGDEVHSRNSAATLLFLAAVAAPLVATDHDRGKIQEVLRFLANTSQFFLNLSMVSAKATMDAARGIENSSIVTAIARNGVTTAIRVSGLGDQWFQSPSGLPVGLFFPGYSAADANPDLGDSAITETAGFGGFSLAASPALVQLVGGSVAQAVGYSREMAQITTARNPAMSLPNLDFAGSPIGIDIRKVVDTGIAPVLTTGIAHKLAGVGQIGAGIVRTPMECYVKATVALAKRLGLG